MADIGQYFAASDSLAGSAGGQTLWTIENPPASTSNVLVRRLEVRATVVAVGTIPLIQVARFTGRTAAGTVIAPVLRASTDASPNAIVKSLPTQVLTVPFVWAGPVGALVSLVGPVVVFDAFPLDEPDEGNEILLAPNEGIGVFETGSTVVVSAAYVISVRWGESNVG